MTRDEKIAHLSNVIEQCEEKYLTPLNDQVIESESYVSLDDKDLDKCITRGGRKAMAFSLNVGILPTFELGCNEFVYRVYLDLNENIAKLEKAIDPMFKQILRTHIRTTGAHPSILPVEGNVYLTAKSPGDNKAFLKKLEVSNTEADVVELRFYSQIV